MTISEFTEEYVASRDLSADYVKRLRKLAVKMPKFVGSAELAELFVETTVNLYLASLATLSPRTVQSYRSDILTLWNAASDRDKVRYPITRRVRRPKCPALVVECYTEAEARAILGAARQIKGGYKNGVPRRHYWTAIILLGWDTGLRRGDCWAFRKSALRPDGTVKISQHKTGGIVLVRLRPSTLAALKEIPRDQPCKWPLDPSFFGRHFKKLVKESGVNRGSFKWLRRASGSYVEMLHAGAGHKHLGHRESVVFDRHYDAKLGGHTLPQPPDISE